MKALTPGQSRFLALALLLILVLLLLQLVLLPLAADWRDSGARLESLRQRLAVYQRLEAGLDDNRALLETLRADRPSIEWYLHEATPALAAASLQQRLHEQVARSGGDVVSTQIINSSEPTPIPTVSVQVRMRAELPELVDLLYSLESGRPVLVLNNLAVLSNPRLATRAAQNTPRQRAPSVASLDVRFDMTGFARQTQEVQP